MKKKIITEIIIAILLVLSVPIPLHLKDGGTVEYRALAYTVSKVHRLSEDIGKGYDTGTVIKIFGLTVYDSAE